MIALSLRITYPKTKTAANNNNNNNNTTPIVGLGVCHAAVLFIGVGV
jgi:hypothetical protein